MEPKGFFIYPKRGIAHALSNYGQKQYPSNSLDQNNLVHGFYKKPSWGYCFPSKFWCGYAIPFQDLINMLWNPKDS